MDCLKNLTACMGCTKKHAKCSWKDVRVDELQRTAPVIDGDEQPSAAEEETRDIPNINPSPAKEASPDQGQSQSPSHPESIREDTRDSKGESPTQAATAEARGSEKPEEDKPRFDVRPPPMAQQQANGRGQYTPFYFSPQVKDSIEHDENDEGDRLQALAAQVYRSASQSVRPQTQEG